MHQEQHHSTVSTFFTFRCDTPIKPRCSRSPYTSTLSSLDATHSGSQSAHSGSNRTTMAMAALNPFETLPIEVSLNSALRN